MHQPDELEDYLRGGSALSQQYRRDSASSTPHALDRRVLKQCRDACARPQYLAPLAFAASALLSLAMVAALVVGPQRTRHGEDSPRLIRAAVRTGAPLHLYSSDPRKLRTRGEWLEEIAALRRAGRDAAADLEYRRLLAAYPSAGTGRSGGLDGAPPGAAAAIAPGPNLH
jgi:hypothetical protein